MDQRFALRTGPFFQSKCLIRRGVLGLRVFDFHKLPDLFPQRSAFACLELPNLFLRGPLAGRRWWFLSLGGGCLDARLVVG